MPRHDIYVGMFRRFGGRRFVLQGSRHSKRDALLWAKDIRLISRRMARVVRHGKRWRVYEGPKVR